MDQTLGRLSFWVHSWDIYDENTVPAKWELVDENGRFLLGNMPADQGGQIYRELEGEERQSGWMRGQGMPVFFVKQVSGENGHSFLVAKDISSVLADNRYTVAVMVVAFVMVALGVLACFYGGIQSEAVFMSIIKDLLSSMEHGDFNRMEELRLPVRHRQNEYLIIAENLKDVGMKI